MKAMDTSVITAKPDEPVKKIFSVENVNFYYGEKRALKSINLDIGEKKATAFIGPSGCGKTTSVTLPQSYERSGAQYPGDGTDHARRQEHLRSGHGRHQSAAPRRHDFPEMESISQKHL